MSNRIVERIDLDTLETIKRKPPASYGGRQDGYGTKIPTSLMARLPDSPRWRRVYCCCWSNAATYYLDTAEGWIVLY